MRVHVRGGALYSTVPFAVSRQPANPQGYFGQAAGYWGTTSSVVPLGSAALCLILPTEALGCLGVRPLGANGSCVRQLLPPPNFWELTTVLSHPSTVKHGFQTERDVRDKTLLCLQASSLKKCTGQCSIKHKTYTIFISGNLVQCQAQMQPDCQIPCISLTGRRHYSISWKTFSTDVTNVSKQPLLFAFYVLYEVFHICLSYSWRVAVCTRN